MHCRLGPPETLGRQHGTVYGGLLHARRPGADGRLLSLGLARASRGGGGARRALSCDSSAEPRDHRWGGGHARRTRYRRGNGTKRGAGSDSGARGELSDSGAVCGHRCQYGPFLGVTSVELLLTFYGDDFTGSADAMEALALGGVPTALFLEP